LGAEKAICQDCDKRLDERIVKLALWIGEELVLLEDVPASVCSGCGKKYFSLEATEAIGELGLTTPRSERKIEVPVFSFAELMKDKRSSGEPATPETELKTGTPGVDPGIYFYA